MEDKKNTPYSCATCYNPSSGVRLFNPLEAPSLTSVSLLPIETSPSILRRANMKAVVLLVCLLDLACCTPLLVEKVPLMVHDVTDNNDTHNLLTLLNTVYIGPPCQQPEVKSCQLAVVNWKLIENCDDIVLPTGDRLSFVSHGETSRLVDLGGKGMSLVYKGSDETEAMLTFKMHSLYGRVKIGHTKTFIIETVGENIVWAEIDQAVWKEESHPLEAHKANKHSAISFDRTEDLLAQGRYDSSSITEYTVTVYYNQMFKQTTADPHLFIDQVIAETNEGYKNSNIPVRVRLHCVQESDIQDGQDSSAVLQQFSQSQTNFNAVRKSADAAILLVNSFSSPGACGVNWFDTISAGQTIGTVAKGCALGYYSFGHEIAHGFGLAHDRRVASSSSTNYGYGNIIMPGRYRTIMAYSSSGELRVNYYSNPAVNFQGVPTGTASNDNARTLTEARFAAAAIGSESEKCPTTTSSSSSGNSSGTTAEPVSCYDKYSNCPDVVSSCWQQQIKAGCPMSCGLCPGMTPASSISCYDRYSNCSSLAGQGYCTLQIVYSVCKRSCNTC